MARVLITGCSSGFGRASAIELTKRGHEVVATARKPEVLVDLDVAAKFRLDVDDDASVAETVAAAGPIDVLVNNAGFGIHAPFEKAPIAEAKRVFETNVFGVMRTTQAVLPGLRERGDGVIVNVSSVAGRAASPFSAVYGGSKWAVEGMTEALFHEVGHFGIRVHLIEPGAFDTGFRAADKPYGVDAPPYDELENMWDGALVKLRTTEEAPGPEPVAQAIADAIEDANSPFRIPVGEDAALVVGARESMSFDEFVSTMRGVLDLTW
jgi:NAD(P)-dependent dehydrogenase (short-subunit alcohol dehydrogenase family)